MTFNRAAATFAAIAIFAGMPAVALSQNDELQDAQQLLKQGQIDRAMERVDQYLKTRPKDARGRFLRGILLTEQNKSSDAIRVFTELTQDYPELPEPYNNLAVLYASQGQYDQARTALELAIRTHPSYATAHENLGDIYAKMASQAYDKALKLDKGNRAAQTKLNLIKDLFTTTGARQPKATVAKADAATAPAAKSITPATPPSAAAAKPAATAAPVPAPTVAAKPATAPAKDPVAQTPPAKAAAATPTDTEAVAAAVRNWAAAWSNNDVEAYLARYAAEFKTPNGEPRKSWENERRARIAKPRKIEVRIEGLKVTLKDASHATVSFRQHYTSSSFKASSNKSLTMIKSGNQWLIQTEQVNG